MKQRAEDFGRESFFRKEKRYGLYHLLTNELRLFEAEYFFRLIRRMTHQRFQHLLSRVGPQLQRTTT